MDITESDKSQLLVKREAAEILRVTPRTIDRWVAAGRLTPFYTPTGRMRLFASDVMALVQEKAPTTTEAAAS